MAFLELSFELAGLDPDEAEAACLAAGAMSITFNDEQDDAVYEPLPGELRLWPRTRLKALFAADDADTGLIAELSQSLHLEPVQLQLHAVADRVWEREWLRNFHAMRFGRRLWVCPQHEATPADDAVVVQLDPGLAFGTGTHASTALCLEWLDGTELDGRQIIDYGCGSGVLAIAALKLGARRAYATDIDPQALLATRENAARNAVAERLQVCEHAMQLPHDCELLVANILSQTLLSLAPALAPLVRPGGSLLLGGILRSQEPEVAAGYAAWFDMTRCGERDGWVVLHGRRGA